MEHAVILMILVIAIAIHFLPIILAYGRNAANFWGIVVINVFLGWTFLGWVIALTWAVTAKPKTYGW